MSASLRHLLALTKTGKRPGASNAERQSRRLTGSILKNAVGVDQQARYRLHELIDIVQLNPQSGHNAGR